MLFSLTIRWGTSHIAWQVRRGRATVHSVSAATDTSIGLAGAAAKIVEAAHAELPKMKAELAALDAELADYDAECDRQLAAMRDEIARTETANRLGRSERLSRVQRLRDQIDHTEKYIGALASPAPSRPAPAAGSPTLIVPRLRARVDPALKYEAVEIQGVQFLKPVIPVKRDRTGKLSAIIKILEAATAKPGFSGLGVAQILEAMQDQFSGINANDIRTFCARMPDRGYTARQVFDGRPVEQAPSISWLIPAAMAIDASTEEVTTT